MDDYESLCHSVWESKYHVVFIPKYRKKALSLADVWLLYSGIEIIRRDQCADLLEASRLI